MSAIMVSVVQFVVSAALLGGGTAYLAHSVNEDRRPRRKQTRRTPSTSLAGAHHGA